jgi:hypothetical protein
MRSIWRFIRSRLVLDVYPPVTYLEKEKDIEKKLLSDNPDVAALILSEAETIAARPFETADSVERRAMTLQGAVALATTFTLTGSALIFDQTKLSGHGWRITLAIIFFLAIGSFAMCGMRAMSASSRTFNWYIPGPNDIFDRVQLKEPAVCASRAATLLKTSGYNDAIVRVKAGYMNSAVWWFRIALVMLVTASILMLAYAVTRGPAATPKGQTPATSSSIGSPSPARDRGCRSRPQARSSPERSRRLAPPDPRLRGGRPSTGDSG